MGLDQHYIEGSIDNTQRTAFLSSRIRMETGEFSFPRREYLSIYAIANKLKNMGYSWKMGTMIGKFIEESCQHAYERGIFIMSHRSVMHRDVSVDSAQALIVHFKDKEPAHFNALLWYPKGTYVNQFKKDNFSVDIANELGAFTLLHVRTAFTVGVKLSAKLIMGEEVKTGAGLTVYRKGYVHGSVDNVMK